MSSYDRARHDVARRDDTFMPEAAPVNHAAAAWVAGELTLEQQLEFETHLAVCAQCQAEVATLRRAQRRARNEPTVSIKVEFEPPPAERPPRSTARVLGAALLVLIVGFAIGWTVWQLAHR
jgi:anti-sigma factor RsiW